MVDICEYRSPFRVPCILDLSLVSSLSFVASLLEQLLESSQSAACLSVSALLSYALKLLGIPSLDLLRYRHFVAAVASLHY